MLARQATSTSQPRPRRSDRLTSFPTSLTQPPCSQTPRSPVNASKFFTPINLEEVRLENIPTRHRRVFSVLRTHRRLRPNPDREPRLPEKLREVSRQNRRGTPFRRTIAHLRKNHRHLRRRVGKECRSRWSPYH